MARNFNITCSGNSNEPPKLPLVPRTTAVWGAVAAGIGSSAVSILIFAAIDRSHRAPIGDWFADFAKSPGLGGVCAVVAAGLALGGILTQVAVNRRSLEHQRAVDENRAWWDRFEWTAARAVPSSHNEVPLPYNAVLSTLTVLAETASDDVQRNAVGAITEVAAPNRQHSGGESEQPRTESHQSMQLTIDLLRRYAAAAGNSPAKSRAVDGQLYELQVLEAFNRLLPEGAIRTGEDVAGFRPDAIVDFRGRKILVEVKHYTKAKVLPPLSAARISQTIHLTGADAAIIVSPSDLQLGSIDDSVKAIGVTWSSSRDDSNLVEALDLASGR